MDHLWPFIGDLPIEILIFHSYAKLPEGIFPCVQHKVADQWQRSPSQARTLSSMVLWPMCSRHGPHMATMARHGHGVPWPSMAMICIRGAGDIFQHGPVACLHCLHSMQPDKTRRRASVFFSSWGSPWLEAKSIVESGVCCVTTWHWDI